MIYAEPGVSMRDLDENAALPTPMSQV